MGLRVAVKVNAASGVCATPRRIIVCRRTKMQLAAADGSIGRIPIAIRITTWLTGVGTPIRWQTSAIKVLAIYEIPTRNVAGGHMNTGWIRCEIIARGDITAAAWGSSGPARGRTSDRHHHEDQHCRGPRCAAPKVALSRYLATGLSGIRLRSRARRIGPRLFAGPRGHGGCLSMPVTPDTVAAPGGCGQDSP